MDCGQELRCHRAGRAEGAGFGTFKTLVGGGPLNWVGLSVLAASIAGTSYLALTHGRFPDLSVELWEGELVAAPSPALYLSLLTVSFGWSYLLSGAAMSGPLCRDGRLRGILWSHSWA